MQVALPLSCSTLKSFQPQYYLLTLMNYHLKFFHNQAEHNIMQIRHKPQHLGDYLTLLQQGLAVLRTNARTIPALAKYKNLMAFLGEEIRSIKQFLLDRRNWRNAIPTTRGNAQIVHRHAKY